MAAGALLGAIVLPFLHVTVGLVLYLVGWSVKLAAISIVVAAGLGSAALGVYLTYLLFDSMK
jgi:hypothetical protein